MTPPLEPFVQPLDDDASALILERASDARFVLIGESSQGTHEFYELRAELTRQLIEQHEPLERTSEWEAGELPDTYPSAL